MRRLSLWVIALATTLSAHVAHAEPPDREEEGMFVGQRGFSAQLMAGLGYNRLYDFDIVGGDIEVAFGAQRSWGALHGRANILFGSTPEGMSVIGVRVAPTYEAELAPIRVGVGPQITQLGYVRATNGDYESETGMGGRVHLAWDIVSGDVAALFWDARGSLDYFSESHLLVPGLATHLGVRLY